MNTFDLEHFIASLSRNIVIWAAIILAVLVVLSILLRDKSPKLKPWLFGGLAATLLVPTLFLITSTVYLNVRSESGGPVHWHAGIEFWACGTELELRDPSGFLSNKIGTNTYHEHNDKFIHLEGVVVQKSDASLGKFMRVVGGSLDSTGINVPLNEDRATWFAEGDSRDGDPQGNLSANELETGFISHSPEGPVAALTNGKQCGGQPAELQTFVFTTDEKAGTYSQRKIESPEEYVIRDKSSLGPPSDCIVFDFDTPKERTDKLCEQYGVRDAKRCTEFGVKEWTDDLCNLKEVTAPGGTL